MNRFTDQEKINFFNQNWEYISRIFDVLQTEKFGYIRAGQNRLEWLAVWMENLERKSI